MNIVPDHRDSLVTILMPYQEPGAPVGLGHRPKTAVASMSDSTRIINVIGYT